MKDSGYGGMGPKTAQGAPDAPLHIEGTRGLPAGVHPTTTIMTSPTPHTYNLHETYQKLNKIMGDTEGVRCHRGAAEGRRGEEGEGPPRAAPGGGAAEEWRRGRRRGRQGAAAGPLRARSRREAAEGWR